MNPTPIPRAEIYRQVRTVLVRHLIDVGRLTIQISMNHLHLVGSLCRITGATTPLSSATIQSIFSELRMIRGVRRVNGTFMNWRQLDEVGASWAPIVIKKDGEEPPVNAPASAIIDVDNTGKPAQPAG